MTLMPVDSELTWAQVEVNFADVPAMAEQAWTAAGIMMPDDAAEDLKLSMIETVLTDTAISLSVPLDQIYPLRHRIRWLCDTTNIVPATWASIDGGPPRQINPQPR